MTDKKYLKGDEKFILPFARIRPGVIAQELVSVQPMTVPTSMLWGKDFTRPRFTGTCPLDVGGSVVLNNEG